MSNKPKGNPFQRGSTWTFIYYVYDESGTRHQKWKGGYKTKEEAERDLQIYKAKAKLGMIPCDSNDTIEAYLTQWFEKHRVNLQPNTINGYKTIIDKHIIPALGNVKLKNLTATNLQNFYTMLINQKDLSPKTVLYVHNVLKIALKDAVNNGLIHENVCTKVKTPKVKKYKPVLFTQEQMKQLINYIRGNKYEVEIILACTLGLRRGEILGLKFSDVDFERHTITIQRQVSIVKTDQSPNTKGQKYYGLKQLKSESSYRVLSVSSEIENIILNRKAYVNLQKSKYGKEYIDNDLICCLDNGDIMSPQTLYHAYKSILKKCELPENRFHDLRHCYATLCIDMGVNLKVLSQALGHSSTAVTDNVYADSIRAKQELPNTISMAVGLK